MWVGNRYNRVTVQYRGRDGPRGSESFSQVMAGRARDSVVKTVVLAYEELKKEWAKKNRNLQTCGKYLSDIKVSMGRRGRGGEGGLRLLGYGAVLGDWGLWVTLGV